MLFNPKLPLDEARQELKALLAPISSEAPAGTNVRSDPEKREMIRDIESLFKNAVNAERKVEQHRIFPGDSTPDEPRWSEFIDQGLEYLQATSKDLLLATLVAEAAFREYGPRGFLLGIELMKGLVETHWPNLYPTQDGASTQNLRFAAWKHAYDWPDRVAPKLELVFKLTSSGTTFAEYTAALKLDDPSLQLGLREERISKGAKTTEKIRAEIRERPAFFTGLFADLKGCREAIKELTKVIDAKCVSPDPALSILTPDFTRTDESITRMIASARDADPGLIVDESPASAPTINESANSSASSSPGSISPVAPNQMTREVAFAQLVQLANFFRRTEPHSPISYALEQTVRWGKMALPELLTELIANADARRALFERAGLTSVESKSE